MLHSNPNPMKIFKGWTEGRLGLCQEQKRLKKQDIMAQVVERPLWLEYGWCLVMDRLTLMSGPSMIISAVRFWRFW